MRRYLLLALLVLGLLSFIVWLVSQFFLPILPAPYGNSLLIFFTGLTAVAGLLVSVKELTEFLRSWFASPGLKVVDVTVVDDSSAVMAFRSKLLHQAKAEIKGQLGGGRGILVPIEAKGLFPLIDIKLRNTSREPAFLKKLTFVVERVEAPPFIWDVSSGNISKAEISVSYEYNLELDPTQEKAELELPISQEVKPASVDRFVVVVGQKLGQDLIAYSAQFEYVVYRLKATLLYNENSSSSLGSLTIRVAQDNLAPFSHRLANVVVIP